MQQHTTKTNPITVLKRTIIFLLMLFLLSACSKEEVVEEVVIVRPVKIMTVQSGETSFHRSLPGKVRAAVRSELSFKVSGPLVALPIEEGQHVKKGTLVAQIMQRDFLTALKEAKARKLEAEKQFSRYKELYAKKQVSQADYDAYRAARDVARAQLDDAQNRLNDTSLTAPFDGIISKRFVENHQKVQAKEAIANLQNIARIEVLVDIPELTMAALEKDRKPEINASFESIPGKEYKLAVKEYSTQADPATQTYQVVLIMDQPTEAQILPGMTATVTYNVRQNGSTATQAILIPAIAVMQGPGNDTYVWTLDTKSNNVHKIAVSAEQLKGTKDITITAGLTGGETLIIAGLTLLEEGMQVRPWEQQREGK